MEAALLSVHVLAAIVFVGGSAVAASLFPRYAPVVGTVTAGPATEVAQPGTSNETSGERNPAVALALHRITRGYSVVAIIVPVAGMVLASLQDRMGEIWVIVSMVLTAAAGLLLALRIYPRQRDALTRSATDSGLRTLSMYAGCYNLLWAAVVVLMIVRPGAHNGA